MNLGYVAELTTAPVQIWTTDSKLKIQEGFESAIQIWTGGSQFSGKFIKFGSCFYIYLLYLLYFNLYVKEDIFFYKL